MGKGGRKTMDFSDLTPAQLYCPNCGHKVVGYKHADGSVRIMCKKCGSIIFSKRRNPKETTIKLYANAN